MKMLIKIILALAATLAAHDVCSACSKIDDLETRALCKNVEHRLGVMISFHNELDQDAINEAMSKFDKCSNGSTIETAVRGTRLCCITLANTFSMRSEFHLQLDYNIDPWDFHYLIDRLVRGSYDSLGSVWFNNVLFKDGLDIQHAFIGLKKLRFLAENHQLPYLKNYDLLIGYETKKISDDELMINYLDPPSAIKAFLSKFE